MEDRGGGRLGEGPKVAKMLRLRKSKLLPQQVSDLGAFIFVVAMIPVTYLWEVLVVSQALFPEQEQALVWGAHMLFGLLVVVNIAGNFAGWVLKCNFAFLHDGFFLFC